MEGFRANEACGLRGARSGSESSPSSESEDKESTLSFKRSELDIIVAFVRLELLDLLLDRLAISFLLSGRLAFESSVVGAVLCVLNVGVMLALTFCQDEAAREEDC